MSQRRQVEKKIKKMKKKEAKKKKNKYNFPIRVTVKPNATYNHYEKVDCERKDDAQHNLVLYIRNLDAFLKCVKGTTIEEYCGFKALVIDAYGLCTTRALIDECGLSLEDIDIVSKELIFEPLRGAKTGRLWSKNLSQFLDTVHEVGKYDIVDFDFCNVWGRETKACVTKLFQKQLMDSLGVLAVTCAFRSNEKVEDPYQHRDWYECLHDVMHIAHLHGYCAIMMHNSFRYQNMYCFFFKVTRQVDTMRYDGGIRAARDGRVVTDWLTEPVLDLADMRPKKLKKNRG